MKNKLINFFYLFLFYLFQINISFWADNYLWVDNDKLRNWNVWIDDIPKTINSFTGFVISTWAIISMLMIIYWAFRFALPTSDNKQKWKDAVMYGIIWLVVTLSSWFIVNVIISNL